MKPMSESTCTITGLREKRSSLMLSMVTGPGSPPGLVNFHAVAEDEQANAVARDAVVAVGGGVDDQLARRFERVLEGFVALHRLAEADRFAQVVAQEGFGARGSDRGSCRRCPRA